MSDQDYDVIISNKEYQQYKEYKNRISQLEKELSHEKGVQHSKDIKINQFEKDNKFKQTEILFLVNLLKEAIHHENKSKPLEFSYIAESNSASFEVLGQSVMFNKQNLQQLEFKDNQFVKKYNDLLVGVTSLSEKIESQQELIAKLNKMNTENNQLLINKNQQQLLNSLNIEVKSLAELKEIINQSKINSAKNVALINEKKLLEEKNYAFVEEKKVLQENIQKLKGEIKKLTHALGTFTDKLRQAQAQNAELKRSMKILQQKKSVPESTSSYGDKPYKIKLLIDEHIKDMSQSLSQLGGLTKIEIDGMLDIQLKSLLEYIPKSMEKR